MKKYEYVIIGASAAGVAAASKIRSLQSQLTIACFEGQEDLPYNTCLLVDLLAEKKSKEELYLKPVDFFSEQKIDLFLGERVVKLCPQEKRIETSKGTIFGYEKLLLATGTKARSPAFFFSGIVGVFSFHSLFDVEAIKAYIKDNEVKKAVVVGLGLSGVEAADALVSRGINVLLVEKEKNILPRFLNDEASDFLKAKIKEAGASVKTGHVVREVLQQNNRFSGLVFDDGTAHEADLLVVALGAEPELDLARQAKLIFDEQNGIQVNQYLQTSNTSIFAAGDLIQVYDALIKQTTRNSTWPEAVRQGMHAGIQMCGGIVEQKSLITFTSSHFFGISFLSAGFLISDNDSVADCFRSDQYYYQFIIKDNRLTGVIMIGLLKNVGYVRRALQEQFVFDIDLALQ